MTTKDSFRREEMEEKLLELIRKVKENSEPDRLGMLLTHVGLVRGTSKDGRKVRGMELSADREKLKEVVNEIKAKEGIEGVEVWINEGKLKVGDTIMVAVVGGRFRKEVLPALEELIERIKREVVVEREV
jgi:molybdopterin synthase catalytic subunit